MIPFSVLDLCPVVEGGTVSEALWRSRELAQAAERLGYLRFWLAEHHNMPGIASAATSVVIAHVAGGTRTIRVGSGGVMLPNHAPLVIAEQFGTLAALFPGRIDLGLGRAPGTDQLTAQALRRNLAGNVDNFPRDVQELQYFFQTAQPGQKIRAVPGEGSDVPIWLLGSSLYSAQLAAILGLPFSFAAHFAPDDLMRAIAIYRERFLPSIYAPAPYVMPCINVVAAESDAAARKIFTSTQQAFINLRRGVPGRLPAPIDDIEAFWKPEEKIGVEQALSRAVVGSAATVEAKLRDFLAETKADELMIAGHVFDQAARIRSLEIISDVRSRLGIVGS